MKSDLPRPGQTIADATLVGRRDACHLPGVLTTSDFAVVGGQSVLFDGPSLKVKTSVIGNRHGVADPFVKGVIEPGTAFWVFIDPEYVSTLSHHFELDIDGLRDGDAVLEPGKEFDKEPEELVYDRYGSNDNERDDGYCDWSDC